MADKYDYLRRNASSYVTPEEAAAYQADVDQEALANESSLNLGLRRAMHSTPGMLAAGLGQVVEPFSPGLSQPLFDYDAEQTRLAQAVPTKVGDWENINSPTKALQWAGENLGEQIPNWAAMAVAGRFLPSAVPMAASRTMAALGGTSKLAQGFASSLARTTAGSFPLQVGEGAQTLRGDQKIMDSTTPTERALGALGYGALTAPMEGVDEALLLARGGGAGTAVKNVFKDGIKQSMKSAAGHMAKAVPEAVVTEGAPEALQQLTQQGLHTQFNPERNKSRDTHDLIGAALAGTVVGTPLNVAGRGADVAWSNARGLQDKVSEFIQNKFPPNVNKLSDEEIMQHDGDNLARSFEAAQQMADDETVSPTLRQQAADYLQKAQQGAADWMEFLPIAEAKQKLDSSLGHVNRFMDAAKGAYADAFGKEGKNTEFTQDDNIIFDTLKSSLDQNSSLAQDDALAGDFYNYLKQTIADGRHDLPLHSLEQDFGGADKLHSALTTMRGQMVRAGMVEADDSYSDALKGSLTQGRTKDAALAKVVQTNLKLEHGDLSDADASAMAQRIGSRFAQYGAMKKSQREEFDAQLEHAFGKNADKVAEALGHKRVQEEQSTEEADPEAQTVFDTPGAERRFIGSAAKRSGASEDGSDHGGMWRLDHADKKVRREMRQRMATELATQRSLGNVVKSLNPAEYAAAAGLNREELAKQLNTTVENLAAHPARMIMSEAKVLDRDSVDVSTQDIERMGKNTVKELSQKADAPTTAAVEAALKLPASEGRKALRKLGQEHAVKVEAGFVKSNLNHAGAGRFSLTLHTPESVIIKKKAEEARKADDKNLANQLEAEAFAVAKRTGGTEHVLSAQDLIKEMRQRHDATNPKVDNRPSGDADMLRHFAAGISSLMSNPDVAGIDVKDIWGRSHTKDSVRAETAVKGKDGTFHKTADKGTQNVHTSLVGRFGGFFKLGDKVTLNQAIRSQERGGQGVDRQAIAEALDNYPTNLLKGHLANIQKHVNQITKALQAGKTPANKGKLGQYKAILEEGNDLLNERERQDNISPDQLLRERMDVETPADQAVTTMEITEQEAGREKARTFQEETGEPLHPHGEEITKDRSVTTSTRKKMKLARGVGKEHFTPGMRSIEKDVGLLYDLAAGKLKGALNTVLNHLADSAQAVMRGDKALMRETVDKAKSNLAVVTDGMMKKLATLGKAETDNAKKAELRKEYAEAKRLHEKYAEFMPKQDEITHSQKNAESVLSGKLGNKPIFTERVDGIKEDQALLEEMYDAHDKANEGRVPRGRVVDPRSPNAQTRRAEELANRFGKRVVWVERLGADGIAYGNTIFLDPDSGRHTQVLASHELAHTLASSNRSGFGKLIDAIRPNISDRWGTFVVDERKANPKISDDSLREEYAVRLISDFAYRATTDQVRDMENERGVGFVGYNQAYLKEGSQAKVDAAIEKFLNDSGHSAASFENKESARSDAPISDAEMKEVNDYIEKVLGPDVATQFVKSLTGKNGKFEGGSAQWIRKNGKAIIQIVARAANPMSKAHHEAMHEFFQRLMDTSPEAAEVLSNAASSAAVRRQIEQFFHAEKNRAEIMQQLDSSPAERVAYMFQLWAAPGEHLKVGPKTETLFQKVVNFLRKATGMLSNDQKAEAIMQAFHDGKMSEPNAVASALSKIDSVRSEKLKEFTEYAQEAGHAFMHVMGTTSGNLIGNESKALDQIGRLFYNETGSKGEQAFIQARDQKTNQMLNRVAAIFDGVDKTDIDLTLDYLQKGKVPTDPKLKALYDRTNTMLDQIFDYLEKSNTGVKKRKNYFPRVWDVETLSKNKDQFLKELLQHHSKELQELADADNERREKEAEKAEKAGNAKRAQELRKPITAENVAEGIFQTLMNDKGAEQITENEFRVGYTPFMQAANRRSLGWINDEVFAKYFNKDMVHILTTYAAQAAHKGEYTKRMGRDGSVLRQLLEDAKFHEAEKIAIKFTGNKNVIAETTAQLAKELNIDEADVERVMIYDSLANQTGKNIANLAESKLVFAKRDIMAQEGTLGHDISERWRNISSVAITYENTRLLPFSLFAQFLDPLGVTVNGASMSQAFDVFKSGIVGVVHGWKGTEANTDMMKLARTLGIIDAHAVLNNMGSLYSSLYMGKAAKKWNDRLFRINGVEAFTQYTRVAAMEIGIDLIESHLSKLKDADSKRFIEELHLDPAKKDEYAPEGKLNPFHPEVQSALMRFVDSSIVRPNAAIRPAHGSDARLAILFHMKGFTYAFHKVILEKIAHEAKNGNYDPAFTAVLAYIPLAIAVSTIRGIVANGGDEPDWKKRWKLSDYVSDGVSRAGLMGIPQIGLDVAKWGPAEMIGPAGEQLLSAVKTTGKQISQHAKLKETDPERYAKDDPLIDAGHKIIRDALPRAPMRDMLMDKHYRDSSNVGLRAASM